MKLIVQIPCLNERDTLPATLAAIPRVIEGIDVVEVLIVDDGSTDGTAEIARAHGADHVVRFTRRKGDPSLPATLEAMEAVAAEVLPSVRAEVPV